MESLVVLIQSDGIADVLKDSMNIVWLFIGLLIGNNLDYLRIDKIDEEDKWKQGNEKYMYCYLYRLYPVIVMLCAVSYYLFTASNILLKDVYAGLGITVTNTVKILGLDNTGILISGSVDSIISAIIPVAVFYCLWRVFFDNLSYLKIKCGEIVLFVVFTILCVICTIFLIISDFALWFLISGLIATGLYLHKYFLYCSVTKRGPTIFKWKDKKKEQLKDEPSEDINTNNSINE